MPTVPTENSICFFHFSMFTRRLKCDIISAKVALRATICAKRKKRIPSEKCRLRRAQDGSHASVHKIKDFAAFL